MGAVHLWLQIFGYELTPQEFLFAYRPFALFREKGFFSFTARLRRKIIEKIPTSNKGWKTRFFLASKRRFYKGNPQGHRLPSTWVRELRGESLSGICVESVIYILSDSSLLFLAAGSTVCSSVWQKCQERIEILATSPVSISDLLSKIGDRLPVT